MKKGAGAIVVCLAYIVVLSGMLLVHVQDIIGVKNRYLATVELFLIFIFSVALVFLSLRKEKKAETEKKEKCVENYEQFSVLVSKEGLSEREKEVAWLIYRGFTNRQIAEELFIAETTVKKHVTHIYEKCGVSGRKELKEYFRK